MPPSFMFLDFYIWYPGLKFPERVCTQYFIKKVGFRIGQFGYMFY